MPLPTTLAAVSPGDRTRQPVTRADIFKRAENVTTEEAAPDSGREESADQGHNQRGE